MAGHGEKLERKQEQAIAALLTEATIEDAARKARVSYSGLKGWMQLPEFQSAYRAARAGVLERVVARLVRACDGAVARLEENLDATANPHREQPSGDRHYRFHAEERRGGWIFGPRSMTLSGRSRF